MFCLGEESLADHLGERKPREDLDAVQEMKEEGEEKELDDDMPPLELVKKVSSVSEREVSVAGGEDDDIKIV
jgi:hypothetical protein